MILETFRYPLKSAFGLFERSGGWRSGYWIGPQGVVCISVNHPDLKPLEMELFACGYMIRRTFDEPANDRQIKRLARDFAQEFLG